MTSPVVNTSPLIHLGDAGRLSLLSKLFEEVLVPTAVSREVLAKGEQDPVAVQLRAARWARVVEVNRIPDMIAAWDLGAGESAVLALALTNPGTEAIVDDLLARRCAQTLGVPVCGTLGLVLRAARKGLIENPVAVIYELSRTGMRLSPKLFEEVLAAAREYE